MPAKVRSIGHSGHLSSSATNTNIKALKITAWITGVYFVIELGIGIYSGSVAVISDAFHTFSAVGGTLLALVAGRIAMRPADHLRTFGLKRAEIIGAMFNGFFLLIMAFIVIWLGIKRIQNPIDLPTTPMLIAAFGGLITEFVSMKLLYQGQKGNLNMKGAYWHILQTFVGSIIIIIVAVVIRFTGFNTIDPLLGMLFGLILIYAAWSIIRGALDILLESVPPDIDLKEIKTTLEAIKGVENIHHTHAWVLTSGQNIFSTHLKINNMSEYRRIFKEAHKYLKEKFNFYFSTIQIEDERINAEQPKEIDIKY